MADVKAGIPNALDTEFHIASVTKEFTPWPFWNCRPRAN
jgi:hypothetical protein